jgi:hypothetical protein
MLKILQILLKARKYLEKNQGFEIMLLFVDDKTVIFILHLDRALNFMCFNEFTFIKIEINGKLCSKCRKKKSYRYVRRIISWKGS